MNLDGLNLINHRPAISYSKLNMFKRCPRQYALSAHGNRNDRELNIQKRTTGRALLVGSALHLAAAAMLRNMRDGLEPDIARARKLAGELIHDTLLSSRNGMWRKHPEMPALDIHYEGKREPDRLLELMLEEVNGLIDELLRHVVFERIRERALDHFDIDFSIVEIDAMPREPVMVSLVPLWARFDLVIRYRDHDRRFIYCVIDWKTGRDKPDDWAEQAGLYALAVARIHCVAPENVWVLHVNVQTGTQKETHFDEESLSNAAHDLDQVDDDIGYLEKQHGRDNPMTWPAVPFGSSACRWCSFKRRCGREDS